MVLSLALVMLCQFLVYDWVSEEAKVNASRHLCDAFRRYSISEVPMQVAKEKLKKLFFQI